MTGRVHQVEDVVLAILGPIIEPDGLGLDGDAALALDIHRIEHLLAHVAQGHGAGGLDQPVGEGRFAMVDMGDDGEIADIVDAACRHGREIAAEAGFSKRRLCQRMGLRPKTRSTSPMGRPNFETMARLTTVPSPRRSITSSKRTRMLPEDVAISTS